MTAVTRTYPKPADPVSAFTRADGTSEPHSYDHGRVIGLFENVQAWGATGDGTTDDYAAIQACINSGAGTIYFPPTANWYAVGTALVPISGQHYLGSAAAVREDTGATASRIRCRSSNTTMWDLSAGKTRMRFENLVFEGRTTTPLETAFLLGSGDVTVNDWINCNWYYMLWAFLSSASNGQFTTNNFDRCEFGAGSPIKLYTNSYANNLHWNLCRFHVNSLTVPMVDIKTPNAVQGIFFDNCYAESLARQLVRVYGVNGFRMSNTYLEAIDNTDATYTTYDGKTIRLPTLDFCNDVNTQGFPKNVRLDGIFWGTADAKVGSSDTFGATLGQDISFFNMGDGLYGSSPFTKTDFDLSRFTQINGHIKTETTFADAFDQYPQSFSVAGVMPWISATYAPKWYLTWTGSSDLTIPAPEAPGKGQRLLIIFDNPSGRIGTVTWNGAFVFTGGSWSNPASNKRKHVEFIYDGQTSKWMELYRSGDYT